MLGSKKSLFVIFLVALALFVALSAIVVTRHYFPGDLFFKEFFARDPWPSLSTPVNSLSFFGSRIPATMLLLLLYWRKPEQRQLFLRIALGILIVSLVVDLIKLGTDRARPNGNSHAFPSGHVALSTFYYGILYIFRREVFAKRAKSVSFLLLLLLASMGFNRMYLQAHWFSDALGGYLLGGAVLSMFYAKMRFG